MLVRRLDSQGEPCYGHGTTDFVTGADAVATLVGLAVRMNLGEWFFDASLGVAWWQQVDGQRQILGTSPVDLEFARAELLRVILSVQGVESVQDFALNFNAVNRTVEVVVRILTVYGVPRKIVERKHI